jgi:hypothetical protein
VTILRLALLATLTTGLRAGSPWQPLLQTAAAWNSNATNADRSSDVVGTLQTHAEFGVERRFTLTRDDALFVGARLEAEAWPRFDHLNQAAAGPRITWRHKFGLGALAPAFSIELAGRARSARESGRNGLAGSVTAAWRKRLDERNLVAITHQSSREDAHDTLFDRSANESTMVFVHDLDDRWRFTATTLFRRGDILSYATPPRTDLVQLARLRETVETFGSPLVAYSIRARTWAGGLAASHAFGNSTAVTLGYEFRDTAKAPLRYRNHLVSATLAHQF